MLRANAASLAHLSLHFSPFDNDAVLFSCPRLPALSSLALTFGPIAQFAPLLSQLTLLKLNSLDSVPADNAHIASLIALRQLVVYSVYIEPETATHPLLALPGVTFEFHDVVPGEDPAAAAFIRAFPHAICSFSEVREPTILAPTALSALHPLAARMEELKITSSAPEPPWDILRQSTALTLLELGFNCPAVLADWPLPRLRFLRAHYCTFDSAAALLHALPSLEHLDLHMLQLTGDRDAFAAECRAADRRGMQSIRVRYSAECRFGAWGLKEEATSMVR